MNQPGVAGAARGIAVAAGSIAAISIAARAIGFGRWFAFSHSVGATCVGTVYQSVNAVPNVLYEIAAGGVLAAVVIPLVSGALGRGQRVVADRTASALLTWALVVLVPIALVVVVLARPIAGLLLPSTDCAGALGLGEDLLRLFAIQVPLYGIGIVLAGVLQSHGRFIGAALAPVLSSVVVIGTYVVYRAMVPDPAAAIATIPGHGVVALGVGTSLGVVALSLPLLVPLRRAGVRLRPTLRFPASTSGRVRRLAVAGLIGLTGQQLATLVIIRLANDRGGPGTLNVFTYVQAVALLPYAVLAVPLATVAFPTLAGQSARRSEVSRGAGSRGTTAFGATAAVGVVGPGAAEVPFVRPATVPSAVRGRAAERPDETGGAAETEDTVVAAGADAAGIAYTAAAADTAAAAKTEDTVVAAGAAAAGTADTDAADTADTADTAAADTTDAPGAAGTADAAVDTLRAAWLGTLIAGLYSVALLVAVAQPIGAFFSSLDAGREAGSGAAALAAIPVAMVSFAPGVLGLGAIGLLTRALYVRGQARLAGVTAGAGWLLTLAVPLIVLNGTPGPGNTLRAIGIGSSAGLLVAALVLAVVASRAWGWQALRPPARPLGAALLGSVLSGAAGWWLGSVWRTDGLAAATMAVGVAGLLATIVFVAVSGAADRTVLRRLLRRSPATAARTVDSGPVPGGN